MYVRSSLHVFSRISLVFFFFSVFLLLFLQYDDVEDISEKKRAMGLGNVISEEREFSVSLETKDLVFYRLHKRQCGWKENLKITT